MKASFPHILAELGPDEVLALQQIFDALQWRTRYWRAGTVDSAAAAFFGEDA